MSYFLKNLSIPTYVDNKNLFDQHPVFDESKVIFPGCPLSLRSICRLTIRSLLGRERLGVISKLKQDKYLSQELLDFLMYRRFNPIEAFLSTPVMKSMLTSLTYMMDNVSPKGNKWLYAKDESIRQYALYRIFAFYIIFVKFVKLMFLKQYKIPFSFYFFHFCCSICKYFENVVENEQISVFS